MPCIPEQNQKDLEYSTWQLDKKGSDNEMILIQNSRFDWPLWPAKTRPFVFPTTTSHLQHSTINQKHSTTTTVLFFQLHRFLCFWTICDLSLPKTLSQNPLVIMAEVLSEGGAEKKVMVASDESEYSYYALNWVLDNLKESIIKSPLVIFMAQLPPQNAYTFAASLGFARMYCPVSAS